MKHINAITLQFLILTIFFGLNSFGQSKDLKETQLKKSIKDIDVFVTQSKSLIESPDIPFCSAKIDIFKNGIKIDSIIFSEIEAVGGNYGLLVNKDFIKNHIVISKFGDYEGKTIIINDKGQKFITIGGYVSIDSETGILFSIYDSDLSGLSVFDLNNDQEIFKIIDIEDRPQEFYKYPNSRFLFSTTNDETGIQSIWEIEVELDRIMQLDLTVNDVKGKELKKLTDYEKIEINCE
jgi:hypothetical protein